MCCGIIVARSCHADVLLDHRRDRAQALAQPERAMRGEIAFEPALRERVALLKGLPISVIDTVIAERIRLTPGGRTLVATMRAHGAYTCLVSGGFTAFTSKLAAMIGFDEQRANTLLIEPDGKLTGAVAEPIVGREAKLDALLDLSKRLGLERNDTLAVGDGANDIPMLSACNEGGGLGVAYHAKPKVREIIPHQINRGDLSALLYAQGYKV